jgi:hypothetical protein
MLREPLVVGGYLDQGFPLFILHIRKIQIQIEIDIDNPGDILRPLDIATHPVNSIGHTTKHNNFDDYPLEMDVFLLSITPVARISSMVSYGYHQRF